MNIKLANARKQLPQVQMVHLYLAQGMSNALEDGLASKTQSLVCQISLNISDKRLGFSSVIIS